MLITFKNIKCSIYFCKKYLLSEADFLPVFFALHAFRLTTCPNCRYYHWNKGHNNKPKY